MRRPLSWAEYEPGPLLQQVERTWVLSEGKRLSYFGGCDYFRLSSHVRVRAAMARGLRAYGINVAASRLTTGNHPVYGALEAGLAGFFGVETATLVSIGYLANTAAAQALAGHFSHAFLDADSHASLADAAGLLGARLVKFRRGDAADLQARFRTAGKVRRAVVLTEGLFAHNGEVAPLWDYLAVMPSAAMLFLDDAHGVGTLGEKGRGTAEQLGLPRERIITTMTLSKGLGVYGGAVLGPGELQRNIWARSAAFAGSTPLPPALALAACEALRILENDRAMLARLRKNTTWVKERLKKAGLSIGAPFTPIVGVAASAERSAHLRKRLRQRGVYPSFIRYPGGPREGFFRFAISSEHTAEQLEALVAALC